MSAARAKGNAYENSLIPFLERFYRVVRRIGLPGTRSGDNGLGDFLLDGEPRYVLEAKCHQKLDLGAWHGQASSDAVTAARKWRQEHVAAVVVHKRHGTTAPAEQWVTMSLADFLWIAHGHHGVDIDVQASA